MRPKERIPLHDHSDNNSGGKLAAWNAITGLPSPTTTDSGGGSGARRLNDLDDVNAAPADNDALTWDSASGQWVAEPASTVAALDDLTDVTITSATAGDRLRYTGSGWANSAAIWVPVMVEDGATGLWYVAVTGDGDAVMTEVT